MIACDDNLNSPYKDNLYCAWTEFSSTGAISVMFNRSVDGGSSFSPPIVLENGFGQGANVQTGPNGNVYVCWANYGTGTIPANGIGFTKSVDGGASFSTYTVAFPYSGIRVSGPDPTFNYINMNDFPSMAVDKSNGSHRGRIYITYPAKENGNGKAIIQVRSSDDEGLTWSGPYTVSIPNGRQNFFPWIAVYDSTGTVCVVYYSFDSISGWSTNTYMAYSKNGTVWNNMRVSDVSHITDSISNPAFKTGYAGDYIGVAAYGGKAYPAWMDDRNGTWQVYVSPVHFVFPTISGPDVVYSTANYVVKNPIPNTNVTWSVTPSGGDLYIVSQNNDTAVVGNHHWYTSNFTLNATIKDLNSDTLVITKTLMARSCPSISATYTMQPCHNQNGIYNQPFNLDGTPNFIDYGCPITITFTTSATISFQLTSGTPLTWTSGTDYLYVAINSPVTFSVNFAGDDGGLCTKTILLMPTGTYYTYSLSVSPNPASSTLNVNINTAITNSDTTTVAANTQSSPSEAKSRLKPNDILKQNTVIELYNMITSKLTKRWNFANGLNYQLNVSGIQRGMYIMKVYKGDLQLTSKVMIE